jgi:hypothetical protein
MRILLSMKPLLILLTFLSVSPIFAQITIKGVVKDANGNAPIRADAHIGPHRMSQKHERYYTCDPNGHFEFTVDNPGVYTMRLSAVNHVEVQFPLVLDGLQRTVEVNARLKPNAIDTSAKVVRIIYDVVRNVFTPVKGDTMVRSVSPVGNVIFETHCKATADTLGYQVTGVSGARIINGTQSDRYVYDGGGDYISVLRTHRGDSVKITLDPSKYPHAAGALPVVEIKDSFLDYTSKLAVTADSLRKASYSTPDARGISSPIPEKHRAVLEFLKNEIEHERAQGHDREMQFAAVLLANIYFDFDSSLVPGVPLLVMSIVPAHSMFWAYDTWGIYRIISAGGAETAAYRKELETNPDKGVRAFIFLRALEVAFRKKDDSEKHRLYNLLKSDYMDMPDMPYFLSRMNPDAPNQK